MENERTGVGGDLPLKEIARAWSKVSDDNPEMLMAALVTAFWRGDFVRGAQSALFMLQKPDSSASGNSTRWPRRPGDYASRGEVVLKVGQDGESNPTAESKRFHISREHIARMFYTPRGQRGIMQGEPAGFEGWSFEKRDLADPNWRAKYEESYRALSTIPIEQWSRVPYDMRDLCSLWRIRRHDFARWYRSSLRSAGAPLDSFWPTKGGTSEPHRTRAVVVAAPKQTEGSQKRVRGPRPRKLERAIEAMKKEDPKVLDQMLEKEMETRWGDIAGRTCLRKARSIVQSGNSDK